MAEETYTIRRIDVEHTSRILVSPAHIGPRRRVITFGRLVRRNKEHRPRLVQRSCKRALQRKGRGRARAVRSGRPSLRTSQSRPPMRCRLAASPDNFRVAVFQLTTNAHGRRLRVPLVPRPRTHSGLGTGARRNNLYGRESA